MLQSRIKLWWLLGMCTRVWCRSQRLWLVAKPDQAATLATVPGATPIQVGRHSLLWRAPPRDCAGAGP